MKRILDIYINFASFPKKTMVIETKKIPKTKERKFFGIREGIPFFKDENLFYTMKESGGAGNFEAIEIVITFSSDKKDYFLSISKLGCNTELFDFYNNI